MKKIIYLVAAFLCMACSDDNESNQQNRGASGGVTEVTPVTSDLSVDLSTDKAFYKPGEKVVFTADDALPAGTKVRYRLSGETVGEESVNGTSWTWQPPTTDFKGYMAELYRQENGTDVIVGTIAVDVSSDPARFPRYGFVADFSQEKTAEKTQEEMEYLNRHHINWVQFQDWHNKHHWPLGGTRTQLDEVYMDIANREVYASSVKNYIEAQHRFGMKSMFYNLCFGALKDAATDGVKEEWYLFKDASHTTKDSHDLPGGWKSNIYLVDPSNKEWQKYLGERNDDVYANFAFDGYQIDQLGRRSTLYNYSGIPVNLREGYASFIEAMKQVHPDKSLVMNAVSRYGARQIGETDKVDFFYNEVWADEADFTNLKAILYENGVYGDYQLNTVFAAYMNYNKADNRGEFNTPGILLTDAVMFALGGSHLELGGDHMLCKEYFPNENLTMSEELKTAMVHYYDFLTSYQNLLRDGGTENSITMNCTNGEMRLNVWPPQQGSVTTYAKQVGSKQVIHLLNFSQANSLSWRDVDGTMPEPTLITKAALQMNLPAKVNKLWVASPDVHGGALQELAFTQENGVVSFTLPSLKYWTMIVAE